MLREKHFVSNVNLYIIFHVANEIILFPHMSVTKKCNYNKNNNSYLCQ